MFGNLLGGVLSFFGQRDANAQNQALARDTNAQNWANSQYMASNSIQLRKADAEKAGIHPLYAMGAPTMSFAPAQVGAPAVNPMSGLASSLRESGQDISRAAIATADPAAKVGIAASAQQTAAGGLQLENMKLQNDLLKIRIQNAMQPGTPPGIPGALTTNTFDVPENKKLEERPPLMFGGYRIPTHPGTSPQKAFADQYGDEGPVSWLTSLGIAANDLFYNAGGYKRPSSHSDMNPNYGTMPAAARRLFAESIGRYFQHRDLPSRPSYRPTRLP